MNGATPPRAPDSDEAFARLRAADPARDAEPDLQRLRRAVAARLDAPSAVAAPPPSLAGHAGRENRVPTRRLPRQWFAVAAVAAGALMIGGTGFGLGAMTAARAPAGDTVTLAQGLPVGSSERGGTDAADAASTSIYPPIPWRIVFTASGLSDAPGRAPAWGLDAAGAFSKETAERVARALGLEGEATQRFGAWVVGAHEGRTPSVTLSPDGAASVNYYDPTKDPYLCGTAAAREDAAASGIRCAPPGEGSAPRGADAARQMRDLLAAMGIQAQVEVETTEYDVPETGGPRMTSVTAHLVLEGKRAGLTWSATLVANGVQSFYGPTAALVTLGDYDVVSENEAVRRLGDPRFGSTGGPIIALDTARGAEEGAGREGAGDTAVGDTAVGSAQPEPAPDARIVPPDGEQTVPPTPEPGARIPWPVTEVTITEARLGLAQQTLPDGATVLVPAYELRDADGRTWTVLAVADAALDFAEPEK